MRSSLTAAGAGQGGTASRLAAPAAVALDLLWTLAAALSLAFALWIVVDTLRTVVPILSPFPWLDAWATMDQFADLRSGARSLLPVLFAQHNEHRILVPRLVFFADDFWCGGQERLTDAVLFLVVAGHAALFVSILAGAETRAPRAGRWAIAGLVVALLFSLRQAENFSTGFQLQFVGVFAAATLAFVLFGRVVRRAAAGRPTGMALCLSLAAMTVATFTMANGLLVGVVLVLLALAARLGSRIVLICGAWTVLLGLVYAAGYEAPENHAHPLDGLLHPLEAVRYVALYLGNIADPGRSRTAYALGGPGLS